jgi:hypothetical protein
MGGGCPAASPTAICSRFLLRWFLRGCPLVWLCAAADIGKGVALRTLTRSQSVSRPDHGSGPGIGLSRRRSASTSSAHNWLRSDRARTGVRSGRARSSSFRGGGERESSPAGARERRARMSAVSSSRQPPHASLDAVNGMALATSSAPSYSDARGDGGSMLPPLSRSRNSRSTGVLNNDFRDFVNAEADNLHDARNMYGAHGGRSTPPPHCHASLSAKSGDRVIG